MRKFQLWIPRAVIPEIMIRPVIPQSTSPKRGDHGQRKDQESNRLQAGKRGEHLRECCSALGKEMFGNWSDPPLQGPRWCRAAEEERLPAMSTAGAAMLFLWLKLFPNKKGERFTFSLFFYSTKPPSHQLPMKITIQKNGTAGHLHYWKQSCFCVT